jgi:hypothetical protein
MELSLSEDHISYLGSGVVRKRGCFSRLEKFLFFKKLVNHLIENPDPTIVPILRLEDLGFDLEREAYRYTYDMVRLQELSSLEKRLIGYVVEGWAESRDLPSDSKSEAIVNGWKQFPKLLSFLELIITEKRYGDLHEGNVMLDKNYNYALIDIEGFISYPLDDPKHNWFLNKIKGTLQ